MASPIVSHHPTPLATPPKAHLDNHRMNLLGPNHLSRFMSSRTKASTIASVPESAAAGGSKKQKEWSHGYIRQYSIQFVDKQDLMDAFEAAGPPVKSRSKHAAQINTEIRLECAKSKCLDDITSIFRKYGISDMSPSTVCKVMSTVSDIALNTRSSQDQELLLNGILSALLHQLVDDIGRVHVRHLGSALLQLGRARYYPSEASPKYNRWADVMTLMRHCRPVLFLAETNELGRLVQGLARLVDLSRQKQSQKEETSLDDLSPEGWMEDFCKVSQSKLPDMTPQNWSSIVWGIAKLGHLPSPSWVRSFLHQSSLSLSQAGAADLSYTSWALLQTNQMALNADPSWWDEYQRIQTPSSSPLVSIIDDAWADAYW
jgi:hypothetical protein